MGAMSKNMTCILWRLRSPSNWPLPLFTRSSQSASCFFNSHGKFNFRLLTMTTRDHACPLATNNLRFYSLLIKQAPSAYCEPSSIFTRHCHSDKSERPTNDKQSTPGKGVNQSANFNHTSNQTDSKELKENIYTIPNYLTVGRFCISPFLGYMVFQEQFAIACGLFMLAGFTDLLDGYIARNWKGQSSHLGSVIDPLADKFLVTILAVTLTAVHLIPVWLTMLILSRDVYLVFSGFRVRWITLPPPKTFRRYFDFSHPTASVQPSFISKVNTNVQLLLLTATCAAPVFGYVDHIGLQALWALTAVTTTWSFVSYLTKAPYTTLGKP